MPTSNVRFNRVQRDALEAVRRVASAPLDSIQLRQEVFARTSAALPSDMSALATTDPEFGIFAHGVTFDYPGEMLDRYYRHVYPMEAATRFIDLARGEICSSEAGPIERDYMRDGGVGAKLRVAFAEQGRIWGGWCIARRAGAESFTAEEQELAMRIAPIVAMGLRRAALLEAADTAGEDDAPEPTAPGVAVYDARGSLVLRDARAARYLCDLHDIGHQSDLPVPVAGALTQLRWRLRAPLAELDRRIDAGVRVRGASGRWYSVHASAAEATADAGQSVVVLTPLVGGERANVLAHLYGLTPREREVISLIARGESGKRIAALLGLSAHTVQAHIDNACAKMGVRGRRELVARLFVDSAAQRMAS